MISKLSLLTVVLFFGLKGQSQNTVALIDLVVGEITSELAECRKVEEVNSEQGYRWLYYRNDEPVLIEIMERGRIEKHVTWFFYNKQLVYTETVWMDSIAGRKVHTEKTYHYQEAMIAWINNETTFVDASTDEFRDLDKTLRAYGKEIYLAALK
ncbi:MAG: hypothetical protein MUF75_07335 [Bacteroidia bacterium]|jgi:hypothetical protein|nr:hypothetical protein [Bacteroidia bacterium]